jgi:hypothetical protein
MRKCLFWGGGWEWQCQFVIKKVMTFSNEYGSEMLIKNILEACKVIEALFGGGAGAEAVRIFSAPHNTGI